MRFTIKLDVRAPRKLTDQSDFREIIMEQLTESLPESVYFSDEDGNEHELPVEVAE